jgi:hypothetical protein
MLASLTNSVTITTIVPSREASPAQETGTFAACERNGLQER